MRDDNSKPDDAEKAEDDSETGNIHREEVKELHTSHWDLDYMSREEIEEAYAAEPEKDSSEEDSSKEDSSKEDSSKEDSSKEDSSKEDSSKEDSSKEDSSKEDSSEEDSSEDKAN